MTVDEGWGVSSLHYKEPEQSPISLQWLDIKEDIIQLIF